MNSIEIKEFQYNFVKNLELDFELDESKQNELFAIAKNKGIIAPELFLELVLSQNKNTNCNQKQAL